MTTATIHSDRWELAQVLARIANTAPRKSPKPILQSVRIGVNGSVTLSATDLDRYHTETMDHAMSAGNCDVLVNAARLRKAVTSSKAKEVTIAIDDESVCLAGQTIAIDYNPVDMPASPDPAPVATISLPAEYLARMIDRTIFAADCKSRRYALAGLLVETDGKNYLRVVGTDGRRLSTDYHGQDPKGKHVHSVVVPTVALVGVLKALRKADDVMMSIADGGGHVTFCIYKDGFRFAEYVCRTIDGKFPAWRDIIPAGADYPAIFFVGAPQLTEALTAAIAATDDESRAVDLCCADSVLSMSTSSTSNGKYFDTLVVRPASGVQTLDIALDCRFVLDVANAGKSGCSLELRAFDRNLETKKNQQADYPVVIRCDHWVNVIMPLRRNKKQA